MNIDQARSLAEWLELEGHDYEPTVHEEYSGRGMYGRTVAAIVTDAPMTVIGWGCHELDIPIEDVPKSSDSMGLSVVVY